jgi:hypothetical protein
MDNLVVCGVQQARSNARRLGRIKLSAIPQYERRIFLRAVQVQPKGSCSYRTNDQTARSGC